MIMVALSVSVNKTCVKRRLVEKSPWRYNRLETKPRYIGNYASQIKSCIRTLSGSHGRCFRIRHETLREELPGADWKMTSNPVGNKNSWSRKPWIADKKYYGTHYLPMQLLSSYCSSCAHGCSSEFRCCDMHIMQLLKVIGMTLKQTPRKLSVL